MLGFAFANGPEARYRILCLGAHCDDIEIGCGGSLLSLQERYTNASFTWIVFSAQGSRIDEARASAEAWVPSGRRTALTIRDFQDGYFPYQGAEIKAYFEILKQEISPDIIFTHYRADLHQDHRLI